MVSSPAADHRTEGLPAPPTPAYQLRSLQDPGIELKQGNLNTTTTTAIDNSLNYNAAEDEEPGAAVAEKWPGWPGHNVFRLIVPVLKVGSIIGRKGELVKKLCEETRACVRVLEGSLGTADRIVLVSGKEDPDADLSPAMDAVLKVFKRVSGLAPSEGSTLDVEIAGAAFCSIRLLVASSQAIHLIGKQGVTIKTIQESSGASMRILSEDELPSYATSEERIVDIHGETLKVLKALEAVVWQLRKFLVDHSVLPLFEKKHNATIQPDRGVDLWGDDTRSSSLQSTAYVPPYVPQSVVGSDFSHPLSRDLYLLDQEAQVDSRLAYTPTYVTKHGLEGLHSSNSGRAVAPIVTQMSKTMQIPLFYAEDIIGIRGANIAYIRRSSGAVLTVQDSAGLPDEITLEIKGTSSQVLAAEQLIQEFINRHNEPVGSIYGRSSDGGLSSVLADTTYSSSLGGDYGSPSLGGFNFRH